MKQQFSTASNYSEACDMLRSGYVKHVRLNWNIGSDEFFRIASDWCDTGAKIKKDEDGLYYFPERVSYSAPALMKLPSFCHWVAITRVQDSQAIL